MEFQNFKTSIKSVCSPLPGSIPYATKYRLPVKKKYEGYTVIDFFLEVVPRSTKDLWLNKIKNETLLINGKPAKENDILKGGYITEHTSDPKAEPNVSVAIDLLYADNAIIVINKPAPLPMHPSGRFNKNSLTKILELAFPKEDLKIIHRLDANTTGIVILGRNKEIVNTIGTQFEEKSTTKKYLAMVEGIVAKDWFDSTTKIGTEKTAGGGRASSEEGQEAYTEFKVLERRHATNETLLEVTPHTGRTNQIRLHLATMGYPIVGDYGYKDSNYFKNNPLTYTDDCLFLHAWKLSIQHNSSTMNLIAPPPKKFLFQQ
ncbi:RluA family pseudouridine synthase [Wenyingzhuangia sp. IMCC45574]